MTSSPEVWRPAASLEVIRLRAAVLRALREWFRERGVLEVETPALSGFAPTDPHIESLRTRTGGRDVFLQTSPEFTMLEWYRVGFGLFELMDDVEALVGQLCRRAGPARRVAYRDLFLEVAGVDPLVAPAEEIAAALSGHGVGLPETGAPDRQDLLDLLLSTVIEPQLDPAEPVFVYHFPADQAALARLHPGDPRVAERFELFLGGMEIANGFHELADATEQRRRFEADNARRRALGRPELPIDERLLAALGSGLPDCSGVALGVDRLLMHLAGADHIRDVLAFDVDRA